MNTDLIRNFVQLKKQRAELQDELKELDDMLKTLEEQVSDELINEGVRNIRITDEDGQQHTVYYARTLWASSGGDMEQACAALKQANLGEFVREQFNVQQVSAYIREQEKLGEPLPPEVAEHIKVREVFSVKITK